MSEEEKTVATENATEETKSETENKSTETSEQEEAEVSQETIATGKEQEEVKAEPKAPEQYEDFTFPEDIEVDGEFLDEFKTLAKEGDLSQEEAQKLVDFHFKAVNKISEDLSNNWENVVTDWAKQAKEDKEIGGKSFDENMGIARQALDKFGSKDLKEALNQTGMGNHPELLRFLYKVGKEMKEDVVHAGSSPREDRDVAHVLFPNLA